jgi:HSP20 family molecular chaperone IbpA
MRTFSYTKNDCLVIDIELPGTDPKDLKLSYFNHQSLYLNSRLVAVIPKHFDTTQTKADYKYGLLHVEIPVVKPLVTEVPINFVREEAVSFLRSETD